MGNIWVEVCLISARGLQCSTSLWKSEWFAVAWIDPNSKCCTKVDASGNANPVWGSRFAIPVDDSQPNVRDLALNVEVYSRDPIFLTEKLHGSATVVLKEFLAKQVKNSEASWPGHEEVGSYQLRKKKSSKPRGFIDILICVSDENEESNSHPGSDGGGILLLDRGDNSHLPREGGFGQTDPEQQPQASFHRPEAQLQTNMPLSNPMPFPTTNYSKTDVGDGEPSYPTAAVPSYQPPPRTRTPPPPPPPSNVGYIPTLLPRNDGLPPSYVNMPSSGEAPDQGAHSDFAVEAGSGALAAGAVIFGDDFLSGFEVPSGLGDDSLTDPPF